MNYGQIKKVNPTMLIKAIISKDLLKDLEHAENNSFEV